MSPLSFGAEHLYRFISERFNNTTAAVQEQCLEWLQVWRALLLLLLLLVALFHWWIVVYTCCHVHITSKLETKASSHAVFAGQCIPAWYCHTNAHYVGGINNYFSSNHTKYLTQVYGWFFAFLENFRRKFANLVAPPTDGITKLLLRCKAHPILGENNVQIDA